MAAPLPLRADFDAAGLRRLARQPREPGQTRRLPSPSKDGACGDLGRRRRVANRARLDCPLQRQGSRWSLELYKFLFDLTDGGNWLVDVHASS